MSNGDKSEIYLGSEQHRVGVEVPAEVLMSITRDLGALLAAQKKIETTHREHTEADRQQTERMWGQLNQLTERIYSMESTVREFPKVNHRHVEYIELEIKKSKAKADFWQDLLNKLTEKGILAVLFACAAGLFIYLKHKLGGLP